LQGHTLLERYQQLVGSLIYLQTMTRPDIAHAVNIRARQLEAPTDDDLDAAIWIFGYLKGTPDLGLHYPIRTTHRTVEPLYISAYGDSAYADSVKDSKSTHGYVVLLDGMPIHWATRKQSTVARGTMEAEY